MLIFSGASFSWKRTANQLTSHCDHVIHLLHDTRQQRHVESTLSPSHTQLTHAQTKPEPSCVCPLGPVEMATPFYEPRDATGFESSASWAELPAEDQQILSILDPLESQPWLFAKIQHYERYLRALCAAYNNASLIHRRLPPELLMEIFGHVRPKSCQGVQLLHVCRRWRYIALKTPQFWSNMLRVSSVVRRAHAGDALGLERFQTYLERSSPCLIPLNIRGFPGHISGILEQHTHQISSLTVNVGPKEITDLYLLLSNGMPNLRELVIGHASGSNPFEPEERAAMISVQCTEESLPRLQSLRIPTAFLSPDIMVPTLQSLIIGGCACHECSGDMKMLTLDTFLRSLARCPSLQNLQFLSGSEPLLHPLEFSTLSPVSLPLLNKIEFQKYRTEPLSDILGHLVLPPTAALKFDCVRREGRCLPRALHSLPMIPTLDSLEVVTNETKCTARGHAGGVERLSFVTSSVAHSVLVDELLHAFAPAASHSVTRLSLGFKSAAYSAHVDAARMDALLAAFPRVTYLKVARKCHHLFHALAAASELPCPALAHLVVKWTVGWADEEFRLACDIAEKALARRAQRGLRLQKLEVTFRRLYGIELVEVDLEAVRSGVVALFAPYADEVVVALQPDWRRSRSSGSGLAAG
ncbi:hypothetical protein LXA43DRAFT_757232 [Ganoderma leucocontextum]|nr:hypothetical protein LXA43DRAFT_757232 [Ganoderma leucocontextum]